MPNLSERSRYREIKSAFAPEVTAWRSRILGGADAGEIVPYLQQQRFGRLDSVVEFDAYKRTVWKSALLTALKERARCEEMLAKGRSLDDVISYLQSEGFSAPEVAAFVEGLAGLASGKALAIVDAAIARSAHQAG